MIDITKLDPNKLQKAKEKAAKADAEQAARTPFEWKEGTYTIEKESEDENGDYDGMWLSRNGEEAKLCRFDYANPFTFLVEGDSFDGILPSTVNGKESNRSLMYDMLVSGKVITVANDKPGFRTASKVRETRPSGQCVNFSTGFARIKADSSKTFTY